MDAIITYDLSKAYGNREALSGVNLQVPEGKAFACVGQAGAGKTTLIRLLSGLSRSTAGECAVMGYSPIFETEKLHAVAGTVLDSARMYKSMTLSENLRFFAGINGVDENDAIDRTSFLLHRLDIWESRDEKIGALPTGVLRRGSLARALIHSPRVLLMDEPADGLDKETADSVKELLSQQVSQEGVTVLLCTRNMEYAQQLCDGFALLNEGRVMARGDLESLRQSTGVRYRAVLRLGEGKTPSGKFRFKDGLWEKEIRSEEELPKIISQTVREGKKLYEARLEKPTLEEIYAACLTGGLQKADDFDEQSDEYEGEWEEEWEIPDFPDGGSEPDASAAAREEQPEYEAAGEEWPEYETDGEDGPEDQ